ncbi:3'(2'),5'-bisphosphate nucleotidase CysQ [Catalinimonas niigatensis]|uniref:3'(2'),5'-bisphosphate nucleotidase CysQ n=1 Tax=Catalinimonas niigatensis TaxID=1397264 RepID=UPI002665449B|nr:3'(2'),5'-bisphosphate nucleotidase CysQ [Catalinimonas niigatensis]WPP48256.1 3'(2'),5'-bisphosphate nucleotidase CysQ [Catalinimonas niigatensis]
MPPHINISTLGEIAIEAGKEILNIYHHADFSQIVDFKADDSPLTTADEASHHVIINRLSSKYPNIPIISEEGKDVEYATRKGWEYFWLVDPLDGTKEFIKRNGQFTVNIALIHQGKPIVGVIYTPVTEELYLAAKEGYAEDMKPGAYKQQLPGNPVPIQVNNKKDKLVAVRSSSHASEEEEELLGRYGVTESISKGSSLKFCMVAEGKADVYYRHGPTMEWDTAAGQVVVECAGGKVLQGTGPEPFRYNKESLRNGSFLVLSAIKPM